MAEQFTTLGATTLNGAINSAVTSIVVTSAASLPSSGTFRLRLNDAATFTSNVEIVKVTAVSGTTLTVVRGQEGTSAVAHSSGDSVTEVITAAALTQFQTDTLALANMLLAMPADVAVTTTATISSSGYGKLHNCSGTSANYAVTLPDATVAPVGTLLAFKMDAGLTKLVTLTSSTGTQLDGAATRVMWARESCLLKCDGTQWRKIAGVSIPMICFMRLNADQSSIALNTETTILLNATDTDNSGAIANTANNRMVIVRTSKYDLTAFIMCDNAPGNIVRWIASINRDPNTGSYATLLQRETLLFTGSYSGAAPIGFAIPLTINDKLQISLYENSGTVSAYGAASGATTFLSLKEVPDW